MAQHEACLALQNGMRQSHPLSISCIEYASGAHRRPQSFTTRGILSALNIDFIVLQHFKYESYMNDNPTPPEGQPSRVNADTIQEYEYPHGLRLTAILAALFLSIFLASLDATIISTAIPSITNQFHSLQDVGWYGSAMFFPLAATQVTCSLLSLFNSLTSS